MRRFWKSACVVFLLLVSAFLCAFCAFRADAAVLTIEGLCEAVEEVEDGLSITLLVEGQRASGMLSPQCTYEIDGREVSRDSFFEEAIAQRISVDLDEKSNEVLACRLKILRLM
jgi:hypothetical protein